jgi:hypothetical protein
MNQFCPIHRMSAHPDFPEEMKRACKECVDRGVAGRQDEAPVYAKTLEGLLSGEEWGRFSTWARIAAARDSMPVEITILIALVLAAERSNRNVNLPEDHTRVN